MAFKLIKRDYVVSVTALHALFLPLMVYLADSVVKGAGILSGPLFFIFAQEYYLLILLAGVTAYYVYFGKKFSLILLILHNALAAFYVFSFYYNSNSKVAFFYGSFNVLVSIMFISLWIDESTRAIFNPGYSFRRLGRVGSEKLKVRLLPEWGEEISGNLTSWSKNSFFVTVDKNTQDIGPEKIKFEVFFEGKTFVGSGEIVSTYDHGLGVHVLADDLQEHIDALPFHWKDLYTIILDRGL